MSSGDDEAEEREPDTLLAHDAVAADAYSSDDGEYDVVRERVARDAEDTVRAARVARERTTRRCRRLGVAALAAAAALATIALGLVELVAAEHERQHGWVSTYCRVTTVLGADDQSCIYFAVSVLDVPALANMSACAVPAPVVSATSVNEPPACHGPRSSVSPAALAYWRSVPVDARVRCLVPKGANAGYLVRADTCAASTTGGHSVAAVVWRTWVERLVYLVQTDSEGVRALETITFARVLAAVVAVGVGTCVLALATACVCLCCTPPVVVEARARRRARRHRVYEQRAAAAKMA